jgi:hypothetical protein
MQTLGGPCVEHDVAPRPAYVRGRPYPPTRADRRPSAIATITSESLRSPALSARA